MPGAAPRAPSGLSARPLAGGAHLTWTDNASDETGFELERAEDGAFARIGTVVFDVTQFHDAGITPGHHYRYRVRATGSASDSAYSNEVAFDAPGAMSPDDAGTAQEDAADPRDTGSEIADAGAAPDARASGPDASVPDLGAPDLGLRVDAGAEPADSGVTPAVSFQRDVVPIFAASCGAGDNSCHSRLAYAGNAGQNCRGWLSLENLALGSRDPNNNNPTGCPDRTLYQRLTELTAWMCDPERRYIRPGSTAASQIYSVISGNSGMNGQCNRAPGIALGPMPPPGSVYTLPPASAAIIAAWINAGAQNN